MLHSLINMRWLGLCGLFFVSHAVGEARYWVAVGSVVEDRHAVAIQARAESVTGQRFELRRVETTAGQYVRIVAGPFISSAAAEALRDSFRTQGFTDSWVWLETVESDSPIVDDLGPTLPAIVAGDEPRALPKLVTEVPDGYRLNRLRIGNRTPTKETPGGIDWFAGTEFDVRVKAFTSASILAEHDIQRQLQGTPANDHSVDVRMMLSQALGPVQLTAHHSTVWVNGDRLALNLGADSTLDQTVTNDRLRRWRWTWEIDDGERYRSFHRLDRLALEWHAGNWGVTVGRQAVSWGGGIVFQPMDLFSPFSPTVVDRDYKAGDDLVLIDRLFGNGHDLQLLHVARRDEFSKVTQDAASSALKWHGYLGEVEFELVAAEHYGQRVYAGAVRIPVGQALVRADVVASETAAGEYVYSGMLNADVSFLLWNRNAYTFVEYFHNGWGVTEMPDTPALLPEDLTARLARGELFNLMKNYIAAGFTYEWHPLINQSTTLITNLHDTSSLVQVALTYTPGDNQSVQLGWLEPFGDAGDEFGGIPLNGPAVTSGSASRAYLRWVYYF